MNEKLEQFLEDITENFSELFVETFLIKYLSEFEKDDLFLSYNKAKVMLINKISNRIKRKTY